MFQFKERKLKMSICYIFDKSEHLGYDCEKYTFYRSIKGKECSVTRFFHKNMLSSTFTEITWHERKWSYIRKIQVSAGQLELDITHSAKDGMFLKDGTPYWRKSRCYDSSMAKIKRGKR